MEASRTHTEGGERILHGRNGESRLFAFALGDQPTWESAAVVDDSDGDVLYRRQAAQADAEEERHRAAEREARRPVCSRCVRKFTDQRWEETTARDAWKADDLSVCGSCHTDDVARQEAAAEAARLQAAAPPEPDDHGQEPGRQRRGLFRRRP